MKGQDFIDLAEKHIGDPYVLGALVPKNAVDYHGNFDCAEFISYIVFQLTGKLYGCENDNSTHPETADAGTVYWARDCDNGAVIVVPVEQAIATVGAIILREAGDGLDGHIVLSKGDTHTVEAHGHADGVVSISTNGRRWTHGILLPGVVYDRLAEVVTPAPVKVLMVGANNDPVEVKKLQSALNQIGYNLQVDGVYGKGTAAVVRSYQNKRGLNPDGEAGAITLKSLDI